MIRKCCVCGLIMGEKEPLDDKSVTHTYCDICKEILFKQVEEIIT